jgi:ABC-type lipoprotein release transport system permease subunit
MIPLKYNARNLVVRWLTTLLMAGGFMLVVALLVVMLAFVQGLNDLSSKSGPEGNVIILRDGATDELFSDLAIDLPLHKLWLHAEVLPFTGGPNDKMASREVYSIATQEIKASDPNERPEYRFLQVRGVEDPEVAGAVHGLSLKDGRWLSRGGREIVIGDGIARTLNLKIDDEFEARTGLMWKVVGIMDSRGSPFDSELWAKRDEVGTYFGKDNVQPGNEQYFYTSVVVQTKDLTTAKAFAEALQARATDIRINPQPERRYYEELSKSNAVFMAAAVFIAMIMAMGGMFGLMTTMFAAVSQRIKDIGVLRIVGYSRSAVLLSFVIEALLLSGIGGGLGILIGYLFNGVEQVGFMTAGQGGGKTVVFTMKVDASVITSGVIFTVVMGLLGGFLPAFAAMRQRPLEALR